MLNLTTIGADWLAEHVDGLTDTIDHMTPVEYNESVRYLPASVTPMPGPIDYSVTPFMREILNCFDPRSPIREINVKKGAQITFTVSILEAVLLYYIGYLKTLPMMYITADKELADMRVQNNILPMLQESDMGHLIQSSDEGNSRKTGKNKLQLQFAGGGYLVPLGANNPKKMRSISVSLSVKDEVDGWPTLVGKDGCPDALTDDRTSAYEYTYKTVRGSTPAEHETSKIEPRFKEGDQRIWMVACKHCGHEQSLRWEVINKETGIVGGLSWEATEEGNLVPGSVTYNCCECGGEHREHDKEKMFANGYWKPTAVPKNPYIRSYHIPAMMSPVGMKTWEKCVEQYLDAWDVVRDEPKDIGKLQVFYNNILGETFVTYGAKIKLEVVSMHRRSAYKFGEIPNKYAEKFSGSHILFLVSTVDVHKNNLAVCVWGITRDGRCFLVDYWRFEITGEGDECGEITSSVWGRLQTLIEEKVYTADDGRTYRIALTLVDAGYSNATVTDFCVQFDYVYPIVGRDKASKNQRIEEFGEFTTKAGGVGYKINVDHYKDRIAPVLRREWREEMGDQRMYHFNAPMDATNDQLRELTRETRVKKTDDRGRVSYEWHRPDGAKNELWDCLVYANAGVEMIAWDYFTKQLGQDAVVWSEFWEYAESGAFYTEAPDVVV